MAFRTDEIKAGILIVASLILLTGLAVLVAGATIFERYDTYRTRLRAAGGLDVGTPVRYGGVKVGKIVRVAIPADDRSRVELTLGVRKGLVIPKGTAASIASIGFLGDYYLELASKTPGAEPLAPGSLIPGTEQLQIHEMFQRLVELSVSLEGVLGRLDKFLERDMPTLVRRVDDVTTAATAALRDLDQLLTPENRRQLAALIGNLNKAVAENADALRDTLAKVRDLGERADTLMAGADRLVANLDQAVGENRPDVRDVLASLKTTLQRATALLDDLKRTNAHLDRTLVANMDILDETLGDLRRMTQNFRELSQTLKERPSSLILGGPAPDRRTE